MNTVGTPHQTERLPAYLTEALKLVPPRPRYVPSDEQVGRYPRALAGDTPCQGLQTDEFFEPAAQRQAQRVFCGQCPLQTACIVYAMRNEPYGLWGLSETQRHHLGGRSTSRDNGNRRPERAALEAIRNGIDPVALAEALIEVHADETAGGRPVVADATSIAESASTMLKSA